MFLLDKNYQKKEGIEIYQYNPPSKTFEIFNKDLSIYQFHFDTRKIKEKDYFIALKSERDGHDFILDAIHKGSDGIVIETSKKDIVFNKILTSDIDKKINVILTKNTYEFLHHSAIYQRERFNGKVIAVLGSNGKTSTKDFLYHALKEIEEHTFATTGNWNNHIGVPMVLLNMPETTKILVLELGMNHPEEIHTLSNIAKPDIAIITSIGREHMEFFQSLEDVARAELEVIYHLNNNHTLYYPLNAPLQDYVQDISNQRGFKVIFFQLLENNTKINHQNTETGILHQNTIHWKNYTIENKNLQHLGLYSNLFLTLVVLHNHFFHTLTREKINQVLETLCRIKPVAKQRFEIININGITIIDDSYNANPDSFITAIESIKKLFPENTIVGCIAGHMAELGSYSEKGHFLVGDYLAKTNIELIGVCGKSDVLNLIKGYKVSKSKSNSGIPYFENSEVLANNLEKLILPIKYNVILIKGSRSAYMEKITHRLIEVLKDV